MTKSIYRRQHIYMNEAPKEEDLTSKFYVKLPSCELTNLHKEFCYAKVVYEGRTPATIRWLIVDFRLYVNWLQDNYYELVVSSITKDSIQKFLMYGSEERKWKRNSLLNYYKALKSFSDWLIKEKHLTENPFEEIIRPKPEIGLPLFLTKEEIRKVLHFINSHNWTYKFEKNRNLVIFITFIYTGLRISELLNLKMEDIDLSEKVLIVKKGKMQKDRLIPLNEKLIIALKEYFKERERLKRSCKYLWVSSNRDKQLTIGGLQKVFYKLNSNAIINKRFSAHTLRHSSATLLLEATGDLNAVKQLLGHTTLQMALRYSHASISHLKKQMDKVDFL